MNSSESLQLCDLCGGSKFSIISHSDRHNRPLTTGVCEGCGLVSHLPVPGEDEVAAYYAEDYRKDYHGESVPSPRRIMRAWNNGARILNQLSPHIPAGTDIFEVGAGIGCTVKNFEVAGHQASGIEPNAGFNSYTRDTLHADVENTNLYDLEPGGDKSLLLLIHVIEHFSSPTRALTQIRGLLRNDGLLYIECPNIGAPFATFGRLFHFAHIYNFTPATLIALAKKCGYEVVKQFKADDHPDIEILFRKVDIPESFSADPQEAGRTRAAIHRYNWLSYNLRPNYLSRRLCKISRYASEYVKANAFVRELEARFK
ncbi:MAG: class I SAM-dependent methyltransferase [Mariprofundaceae bacterium]|nr:class I SAM-dependent methyltransferase [Mariprofundaceae bacterium]